MTQASAGQAVNAADKSTARQFLAYTYDDSLRMPSQAKMERLVELGWVEKLSNGSYAELPVLKTVALYE